jgi:N4-gp56 family major capsid protein
MASFVRGASSNLTPIEHSRNIFKEHLKLFSLKGMTGKKGSGQAITMDTTLKGKAGETVRYHFIPHAHTNPLRGQDVTILGNESSIEEFSLDLTIDEVIYAFRKRGVMTDQRTIFDVRKELSNQIARHFAQYNEDTCFKVLSGISYNDDDKTQWELSTDTNDRVSGGDRCIRASGANSYAAVTSANSDNTALVAALATTDKMSPTLLEQSSVMVRTADPSSNDSASAVTNTYKMQPMRIGANNEEVFCAFLSLECSRDLRFNADWQNHAFSLADRGFDKTPIATGALGVWNNIIVKPSERVIKFNDGSGNNYARNLLVGADAMLCGWAQTLDYSEELIDHDRELSSAGQEIRGEIKVAFNGVDLGVAQIVAAS